jgi:hypothetical protein
LNIAGTTTTAAGTNLFFQFNGDTAGDYDWAEVTAQTAASAAHGAAATSIQGCTIGSTTGGGTLIFPNYSSTTQNKVMNSMCGENSTSGGQFLINVTGDWLSTSAITSINIAPSPGTMSTTFVLYGRK